MESKFKPGDRIRVIIYGHLMYTTLEGYYSFAKFAADFKSDFLFGVEGLVEVEEPIILNNNNGYLTIDSSLNLVGKEGIIDGSYSDLYPQYDNSSDERNKHIYSISGIVGKSAWYDEEQLELV